MPTFMTEEIARSIYKRTQPQESGEGVLPITYGPEYFEGQTIFEDRAKVLEIPQEATVLVVGCGYGQIMEHLPKTTWGFEPGPWIQAHLREWQTDEGIRSRIDADWVGSPTCTASLKRMGAPSRFDVIIDEDAAPAHTNRELRHFYDSIDNLGAGRIVHLVTPLNVAFGPGDSSQNWKTLQDWHRSNRAHEWISLYDYSTPEIPRAMTS